MPTYIMLTRIAPQALTDPAQYEALGRQVEQKLQQRCPQVRWISSYAVLGPYDYLDVFEAPDEAAAAQVAVLVRSFGHATTETWGALPYERFLQLAKATA